MLFSNALSELNASARIVSNLSLRSSTLCTHPSAALVFSFVTSALGFFPLIPCSSTSALPFPLRSASPRLDTKVRPSFTVLPTSTIHLDRSALRQSCPVATRPKRRYRRCRSSMRESCTSVASPEAGCERMEERWAVMRVFSSRATRRPSVGGERYVCARSASSDSRRSICPARQRLIDQIIEPNVPSAGNSEHRTRSKDEHSPSRRTRRSA